MDFPENLANNERHCVWPFRTLEKKVQWNIIRLSTEAWSVWHSWSVSQLGNKKQRIWLLVSEGRSEEKLISGNCLSSTSPSTLFLSINSIHRLFVFSLDVTPVFSQIEISLFLAKKSRSFVEALLKTGIGESHCWFIDWIRWFLFNVKWIKKLSNLPSVMSRLS